MPTHSWSVTDRAGATASRSVTYATTTSTRQVVVGMSASPETWNARLAEVGSTGIKARRIFCQLDSSGRHQESLIRKAIADGMIPVLSWKVPSVATLISGGYDSWLANLRAFLVSLDVEVTATFWHEPHGNMTPAEFRAGSQRFLDRVKAPKVKVGPILNGWLLDNRVADWTSYTSPALLNGWDFLGLDTYSEGTVAAPSTTLLCGRAIPKAATWLAQQGHGDMPIVIGEYNGQIEAAIKYAGEQILAVPNVWIACVWNMDHESPLKYNVLTGSRLTAFKATKAVELVKK